MKKTTSLILLLFIFYSVQAQQYLSLNLQKNKIYTANATIESTIIQDLLGLQDTVFNTEISSTSFKVKDIVDSLYITDVWFNSLSTKSQKQGKTTFATSDSEDAADGFSTIIKQITYQPFELTLNRSGAVVAMKGFDSIFIRIFDKYAFTEAQKQQVLSQLKPAFDALITKDKMEQVTAIYPSKAVALDETWIINSQLHSLITLIAHTTYDLQEIGKDYFMVSGAATIASDEKETISEGIPMVFHLKGSNHSLYKLDKAPAPSVLKCSFLYVVLHSALQLLTFCVNKLMK